MNITERNSERKIDNHLTSKDIPCLAEYQGEPGLIVLMVKDCPEATQGLCLKDSYKGGDSRVGQFTSWAPLSYWRKVNPERRFEIGN